MPEIQQQGTFIGATPAAADAWATMVRTAESDADAHTQLLYHQLLQLRAIKLVLIWMLIVVPIVLGIITVVVLNSDPTAAGATPLYR